MDVDVAAVQTSDFECIPIVTCILYPTICIPSPLSSLLAAILVPLLSGSTTPGREDSALKNRTNHLPSLTFLPANS